MGAAKAHPRSMLWPSRCCPMDPPAPASAGRRSTCGPLRLSLRGPRSETGAGVGLPCRGCAPRAPPGGSRTGGPTPHLWSWVCEQTQARSALETPGGKQAGMATSSEQRGCPKPEEEPPCRRGGLVCHPHPYSTLPLMEHLPPTVHILYTLLVKRGGPQDLPSRKTEAVLGHEAARSLGTSVRSRPRAPPRGGRIFRGESVPHTDMGLGKGAQWWGSEPRLQVAGHRCVTLTPSLGTSASCLRESHTHRGWGGAAVLEEGLANQRPTPLPWGHRPPPGALARRGSLVPAFRSKRQLVQSTI